jgi:hypothetical protein
MSGIGHIDELSSMIAEADTIDRDGGHGGGGLQIGGSLREFLVHAYSQNGSLWTSTLLGKGSWPVNNWEEGYLAQYCQTLGLICGVNYKYITVLTTFATQTKCISSFL